MSVVAVLAFVVGAGLVGFVVLSAVRTVVLPRGTPVHLSRLVFLVVRRVFDAIGRRARTYEERDRSMALYVPIALMTLPVVWLTLVLAGYAAMQWAVGARPVRTAFTLSGSSLLTLGFAVPRTAPSVAFAGSSRRLKGVSRRAPRAARPRPRAARTPRTSTAGR